jgi:hypothetical protein
VVRRIFIVLDDNEYDRLVKEKGKLTWKEFIFEPLEFKEGAKGEGQRIHKEPLKGLYAIQARALRATGKLINVGSEGNASQREYEQASLLPLYISGEKLSGDEKRELMLILANTLEELVKELHPERLDEVKWFVQALRMLARNREGLYESSIKYFCEELFSKFSEMLPHSPSSGSAGSKPFSTSSRKTSSSL